MIKIALCFRYAQTLLNFAFAQFSGQFWVNLNVNSLKTKERMNSLRS